MGDASTRMKKRGHGRVVVFGRRAVAEALSQSTQDVTVEELRVARDLPSTWRSELRAAAREAGVMPELTSREEVQRLSGEPRHDQGVAARVRLGHIMEVESFLAERTGRGARQPSRLIALDGVTNSQNIGMIVRSAVASGMDGMLWPLVGSPWINGLVIKASAATIYRCPVLRCDSLVEGLHALKASGFSIVGLSGEAGAHDLFGFESPHRVVFVVGSETSGLSEPVDALLDQRLMIPMSGEVESLNVAVAASLACYQATGRTRP